jgi:hypothetical protein
VQALLFILIRSQRNVVILLSVSVKSSSLSIYGSTALCWTLTSWTGDQPVARPLPAHRTVQRQNKRTQTCIPQVGFEPTIPLFERVKTIHALGRAATVIGSPVVYSLFKYVSSGTISINRLLLKFYRMSNAIKYSNNIFYAPEGPIESNEVVTDIGLQPFRPRINRSIRWMWPRGMVFHHCTGTSTELEPCQGKNEHRFASIRLPITYLPFAHASSALIWLSFRFSLSFRRRFFSLFNNAASFQTTGRSVVG